ncbi:MAG: N-acetylmuramoyl-L-alanine amidase [Ruminobacter sp.]|uniref:peptidoglycan recognition protein family protein n=1 Tax=Ruminobacter sp. TaxID=2774296 RepID=UPI001B58C639|nr:N-acetylmuramoyl-L-alanine amidase [Ruminobacter sp.]MBP3748434.1 N-acetylmuramoyl-L-alanine amidase [Ruminobacter sp.]
MANSPLVSYTKLSPNHSGKRVCQISRITPHAVVGQLSVERICGCFAGKDRQASCNYAIGTDGRIGLCVDEQNRSRCSSSRDNDQRAVTIECASGLTEPYAMKPEVYSALIDLCADICRRNGKRKLVWIADRDKALIYEVKPDEMLLTVHRWFARKSCPGNWLFSKLGDFAQAVNSRLGV